MPPMQGNAATGRRTVPAAALSRIDPDKSVILDVRTAMEHAEKRLARPHEHVPLDELNPADFMARHAGRDVYILCRSGGRAARAAEQLAAGGCACVHVVEGGLTACEACGQKLEGYGANGTACGGKPLSLERQVRIAAGTLAAAGALLGLTISPLFTIVPLFVGCGLVFAGVTDRCGMALLLTKAPWNKT